VALTRPVAGWPGVLVMSLANALDASGRLVTGDEGFDADVFVWGPEEISAVLAWDVRERLRELVALGGRFIGGALRLDAPEVERVGAERVASLVELVDLLGRKLFLEVGGFGLRVARSVMADPDPGVREVLRRRFGERPEVQAVMKAPEQAESAMVDQMLAQAMESRYGLDKQRRAVTAVFSTQAGERVEALARQLPAPMVGLAFDEALTALEHTRDERGAAVMSRVATWLILRDRFEQAAPEDAERRDEATIRFLNRVGGMREPALARTLVRFVADKDPDVGLAALSALTQLVEVDGVLKTLTGAAVERMLVVLPRAARVVPATAGPLMARLLPTIDPRRFEVRQRLIEGLARTGDPQWIAVVREHLESPFEEVQLAAIDAVGALGAVADLEVLRPLTGGFLRGREIKDAAKAAIDAIRRRANTKNLPGAVSLVDDHVEGGLALAEPKRER